MLLAIDIGNSNIKTGVFDGGQLLTKASSPTKEASPLRKPLAYEITAAIICSVVPPINDEVSAQVKSLTGVESKIVSTGWELGFTVDHEPLSTLGTDRLINAYAAAEFYGVPAIVCSLGTATTIDLVADGHFRGGIIAPGLTALARALHRETAALPDVEPGEPDALLGHSTIDAIRSGVFFGYVEMIEGMLARFRKESDTAKVIVTGGTARQISKHTPAFDVLDDDLLLKGLQRVHERLFG